MFGIEILGSISMSEPSEFFRLSVSIFILVYSLILEPGKKFTGPRSSRNLM